MHAEEVAVILACRTCLSPRNFVEGALKTEWISHKARAVVTPQGQESPTRPYGVEMAGTTTVVFCLRIEAFEP